MAEKNVTVTGLDDVLRNLNAKIGEMRLKSHTGLLNAVAFIRYDMDRTPPLIPVDKGILRGSWFATPVFMGNKPVVICGFVAEYAWYVHEMVGARFKRPNAGAKFFESALRRNAERILEIIRVAMYVR